MQVQNDMMFLDRVGTAVAAVLGTGVAKDQPLIDAGIDSLGAPCLLLGCLVNASIKLHYRHDRSACSVLSSCMYTHMHDAGAVELRNEISRAFDVELPGTLVFDYPTVSAMSAYLGTLLLPASEPAAITHDGPETASAVVSRTTATYRPAHARHGCTPWWPCLESAATFCSCTNTTQQVH